jgi:hypothetical protein
METQEHTLDERRANCRIWVHVLLWWWLLPFGWILSAYRMRYGIPLYVVIGGVCLGILTAPNTATRGTRLAFVEGVEHAQKYALVTSAIGSTLTVREILESRKRLKA